MLRKQDLEMSNTLMRSAITKSEVRSCFCNGDLRPAPKTFRHVGGVLDTIF